MASMVERLMALAPGEGAGGAVPDERAIGSAFVNGFLGIGLYWAWLYTVCFSTKLFPGESAEAAAAAMMGQTTSYFGYIAVLVTGLFVALFGASPARSRAIIAVASVATAVGTLLLGCSSMLDVSVGPAVVVAGGVLTGMGSGAFLSAWGYFFAHNRNLAPVLLACGLMASTLIGAAILLLPFVIAVALMALLPLAFGAFCHRANAAVDQASPSAPEEARERTRLTRIFPWRPCLALSMTGLLFGFMLSLGFEHLSSGAEMGTLCLAANAAIGVAVFAYTAMTCQNFGFSSAYLAVIPLMVLGALTFAMFGQPAIFLAFMAMRAAYVLFDVMTWMQVSKIYEKTGGIRAFIISRLALEGGFGVGMLLFRLVFSGNFFLFDVALTAAIVVFCVACLLAFMNNNVENAWGLLPKPHESGHRLRTASNEIAERFKLTKRETEVMTLILRGKNGPYIQEKLCISQNTYQTHTRNLYRKLDIHSRQELFDLLDERFAERKKTGR